MRRYYAERVCPACGEIIRDGFYTGAGRNFQEHMAAHGVAVGIEAPFGTWAAIARAAARIFPGENWGWWGEAEACYA